MPMVCFSIGMTLAGTCQVRLEAPNVLVVCNYIGHCPGHLNIALHAIPLTLVAWAGFLLFVGWAACCFCCIPVSCVCIP